MSVFFFAFRLVIIVAWLWVVMKMPMTHGGHLLSFLAGMAVLSLFSDESIKRWLVLPEPPRRVRVPTVDPTCKDLIVHIGSKEEFEEHFNDPLEEERILMAANRHPGTGQIWAVEQPGRHSHVCWTMDAHCVPNDQMTDQGFLTSYGRYVDRREAVAIAVSSNQLLDLQHHPELLFSEDLWHTPPWKKEEGVYYSAYKNSME